MSAHAASGGRPRRLLLYMFYNPRGEVPEYVSYKLARLRPDVDRVIVVCNGLLTPEGRDALERVADVVHVRVNEGFDVHAYRDGLLRVVGWAELAQFDELILANYTFYGPIFPFSEMFNAMDARRLDFWGITAFAGPTPNFFTGEGLMPSHIQSHFIAVRRSLFTTTQFRDYWEQMPPIRSYVDSVLKHEARFTEHFERLGFTSGVYCDPKRYPVAQAAYEAVDLLVRDRCPILKRKAFFNDPLNVDAADVRLAQAIQLVRERSEFDLQLIWKDITRTARPRDLYTNATLLEIPSAVGPVEPVAPVRVAVLAHVYYPELLDEMLGYAKNIPCHFDLYVTTSTEEKKQAIARRLATERGFTTREVRLVENRGRDVAALLVGLRDVVRSGAYDVVCRIHSKASLQDSFGMVRHFKEHLFENLLASPAYVARVLRLFERDARLGVVCPPTIHIGYGTLGRSWFNNKPGAEHWARVLGLNVPFDDHTPLCAHGSMYWFRPQALAALFEHEFKWTDFPQEPHYADGDLPHILERLVVYAAHARGFVAVCAMTPRNAAKNYVHLEYKAHRLLAEQAEKRRAVAFPAAELKRYVTKTLEPYPKAVGVARRTFVSARAVLQRLRGGGASPPR